MKNPHGVEPTRFMKREESRYAIICDPSYGPLFGGDILLFDHFFEGNSCYIQNDGEAGYKCHPEHRSSLFVNTAGPDESNRFSVLDYEVYTH